ncbi:MAG: hypothetical protein M3Q97_05260, partial [Bacteroidota bacterium]|nr:hypothetical protein [Bacteroidota bacterium]
EQTDRNLQFPTWIGYIIGFFNGFVELFSGNGFRIYAIQEWLMPASLFQIFNALFIVLLAPLFVAIWTGLGKRGAEPSSPVKQSIGLAFLSIGYLFIAWGVYGVQPWDKVSMIWLVGLYLIHTVGELCLSPIGLSMVVKLAPIRFVSLLMGVWFMSTATANYLAGYLSALYPEEVKIEMLAEGDPAVYNSLRGNALDTAVWSMPLNLNTSLPSATVNFAETEKKAQKVTSLQMTGGEKEISVYYLKLISTVSGKLGNAVITQDGKFLLSYKRDEQKTRDGLKVEENVEVWNLQPEKPTFIGMPVKNMFDFFMIFVYLSGAAAVILFIVSKGLLKMMHGKA